MDLGTIKTLHRLNQLALIVIDAQKNYSRAKTGTDVSTGIIESKNALSKLGVLTYLIFLDHGNQGYDLACGGLIKDLLQATDPQPIPKCSSDVLSDTKLRNRLDYYGIQGVLVTGYNADGCVLTSMRSMRKHFQVAGISGAIGSFYQNESSVLRTLNTMKKEGYGVHSLKDTVATLSF